jgi:ribose transport system substrate-binding protein
MKLNRAAWYAGAVSLVAGLTIATSAPLASASAHASQTKTWNVAVLVGSDANAYQAAGVTAIKATAPKYHAKITVFDSDFDATTQYTQMQDVITSGKYQAILMDPDDGPGLVSLVHQAAAAHILVGAWNQPIGSNVTTPTPTVAGVTTQVMFPIEPNGVVMGDLTLKACAASDFNPCNVAFLYYSEGSTYDTAIVQGFDSATKGNSSIKVVGGANTDATRQGGLTAAQTLLQGNPNIDVMIGTSQAAEGAIPAVAAANVGHKVYLLGESLTRQGAADVKAGTLYGGSQAMANEEGSLALIQLVKALDKEPYQKGIDPDSYLHSPCLHGVIQSNVSECSFVFNG